jgi:hypothetical protein
MENSEPISPAFNSNNEEWAMDESMIQNRIKNIYQKIADYSEAKNSAMKFTPMKSSIHKKENANPLDDSILESSNGNFANKMLDFGQGSTDKRPESTICDLESKLSQRNLNLKNLETTLGYKEQQIGDLTKKLHREKQSMLVLQEQNDYLNGTISEAMNRLSCEIEGQSAQIQPAVCENCLHLESLETELQTTKNALLSNSNRESDLNRSFLLHSSEISNLKILLSQTSTETDLLKLQISSSSALLQSSNHEHSILHNQHQV